MPSIKVPQFKGKRPKIRPEILQDSEAQVAINCDFDSDDVKPFKDFSNEGTLNSYQVIDSSSNQVVDSGSQIVIAGIAGYMANIGGTWIGFPSGVDVVPSILDNTDSRYYYTGDGLPKQSDFTLTTSGTPPPYPSTWYRLGIPAPTTKLTQALVGVVGATVVSTAYVYTYVTVWDEESAPAPTTEPLDVDFIEGNTVTLSDFLLPADTDLNIDAIRIYRINSGTAASEYQFIEEIVADNAAQTIDGTAIGSYTYSDDTAEVDLGETLPSTNWGTPPSTMVGLTSIFNGVLCGFVGNTLYFSEEYHPYAWNSAYELQFPDDIVGIGFAPNLISILTEGVPYSLIGSSPDTLMSRPLPYPQPCKSKRSIVSTDRGVIYASKTGLFMLATSGGATLTADHFTRQQWEDLNPDTIEGTYYNNKYFGVFKGTTTGFIFNLTTSEWTDIDIPETLLNYITTDGNDVFIAGQDAIDYSYNSYKWDGGTGFLPITWRSKKFKVPMHINFSVARIYTDGSMIFKLYVDGVLVHAEDTNENIFRLPANSRGSEIEIEFEGKSNVHYVILANSVEELIDG